MSEGVAPFPPVNKLESNKTVRSPGDGQAGKWLSKVFSVLSVRYEFLNHATMDCRRFIQ